MDSLSMGNGDLSNDNGSIIKNIDPHMGVAKGSLIFFMHSKNRKDGGKSDGKVEPDSKRRKVKNEPMDIDG